MINTFNDNDFEMGGIKSYFLSRPGADYPRAKEDMIKPDVLKVKIGLPKLKRKKLKVLMWKWSL